MNERRSGLIQVPSLYAKDSNPPAKEHDPWSGVRHKETQMQERMVKCMVTVQRMIAPDTGALIARGDTFMATERQAEAMVKAGQAERVGETASVKAPKATDPAPAEAPAVVAPKVADAPPASIKESGKPKKVAKKK